MQPEYRFDFISLFKFFSEKYLRNYYCRIPLTLNTISQMNLNLKLNIKPFLIFMKILTELAEKLICLHFFFILALSYEKS